MDSYKRWCLDSLDQSLGSRRVVSILGARQCGKTTLAKQFLNQKSERDVIYRTLDDPMLLQAAIDDPKSFLQVSAKTLIIDEIQKAPILLSSIKQIVDENNRLGQFILTGSADIRHLPQVSESLAGRIKNLHLRTLSIGEVNGNLPNFLEMIFNLDFPSRISCCNKRKILQLAFNGGYPEPLRLKNAQSRREWFIDYTNTLILKDLQDISNIRRISVLKELLKILMAWSSKFIDISDLCSKLSISRITFDSYLNALESLYLFERVPAWCKTDYSRVGKKDKLFASDTGLMATLLNWNFDEVMLDPDRSGKIVETFVFHELAIQCELYGAEIYHYKDRENREIDFVIELDDGKIDCIEVKAGSIISRSDFRHMEWFQNNILKNRDVVMLILYSGEDTIFFGKNLICLPILMLGL